MSLRVDDHDRHQSKMIHVASSEIAADIYTVKLTPRWLTNEWSKGVKRVEQHDYLTKGLLQLDVWLNVSHSTFMARSGQGPAASSIFDGFVLLLIANLFDNAAIWTVSHYCKSLHSPGNAR